MQAKKREDEITSIVIEKCISIHKKIGPGLFESVYEKILARQLREKGIDLHCQVPIKIFYKGVDFGVGFRADMVIEDLVILEIKSVEHILPLHEKQLMTYLKLTGKTVGLLLNFDVDVFKSGIKRIVNKY